MNIELTEQEVDIVIAGLGELPAKMTFNLLAKIVRIKAEYVKEREAPTTGKLSEVPPNQR